MPSGSLTKSITTCTLHIVTYLTSQLSLVAEVQFNVEGELECDYTLHSRIKDFECILSETNHKEKKIKYPSDIDEIKHKNSFHKIYRFL